MLNVNIKKLDDKATIPVYAKDGDAGLDLVATSVEFNTEYGFMEYGTGLAIEIPRGYVGYIFPRSSISKKVLSLCNSVGVIDSGYRGEIKFRFHSRPTDLVEYMGENFLAAKNVDESAYDIGDKIGQLVIMPYPSVSFVEVDELSETDRGDGGYGSTGA